MIHSVSNFYQYISYPSTFETMVREIDRLITDFDHERQDIGYDYRWTLDNKQRLDLIDYKNKGICTLRLRRGVQLVSQYPLLSGLFDEVAKIIATFQVYDVQTLYNRHFIGIISLLDQGSDYIQCH